MTESRVSVSVPTEDGRTAIVDFEHDGGEYDGGYWTVRVADDLVRATPEALTAVLIIAFRRLASALPPTDGSRP